MKYFSYTLLLLGFCFCFACKSQSQQNQDASSSLKENPQSDNDRWAQFINQSPSTLGRIYKDEAVKILDDGTILNGLEEIQSHFTKASMKINQVRRDTLLMARKERGLEYEIGEFENDEGRTYKHLVIWQNKDATKHRVFEFTAPWVKGSNDLAQIDLQRARWIELCNQNNAAALVNEMYSSNTLYYNHKPLVQGRTDLIEEYAYMNRENYKLVLEPIIIKQVNEDFIFEIGQCVGSYGGKYILIWRKDEDGAWRIYIDSNI